MESCIKNKMMKPWFCFIVLTFIFTSCISSKKYKTLELTCANFNHELQLANLQVKECTKNIQLLEEKLISANYEILLKDMKIDNMKKEDMLQDEKMKVIQDNLSFAKTSNAELSRRIDDISSTNKVNLEIMKKMLEEAEVQQLKVLNLSLALQKQDSLNIHLVKRAKKNISEQKLKKSLEKLGFVFY